MWARYKLSIRTTNPRLGPILRISPSLQSVVIADVFCKYIRPSSGAVSNSKVESRAILSTIAAMHRRHFTGAPEAQV